MIKIYKERKSIEKRILRKIEERKGMKEKDRQKKKKG